MKKLNEGYYGMVRWKKTDCHRKYMNKNQIAGERGEDLVNHGMWRLAKPCRKDSYKQKPIELGQHGDRD
ncbi:hypothetical protein ILUMI_18443, partial [Ignelater luminosus]